MAKKKSSTSPTARTLALCRKVGWEAGVVEKTLPHCFIKKDLFGFIDVVVMTGSQIVGIQSTSGGGSGASNMLSRIRKILDEPRALVWLQSSARIIVHNWRQDAESRRWSCDERELFESDFQDAPTEGDE